MTGRPLRGQSAPPAGPRQPKRPIKTDPARKIAYEVLRAVSSRGSYANLTLPELLSRSSLSDRDKALATDLTYGALRAQGTLDHVLGLRSSRPIAEVDPALLDVMRLGAYQLLRTRIPTHAAVATTVELARDVCGEGPARFVNAVLRRLAEHLAGAGDIVASRVAAPARSRDPIGYLSLVHAHPRWIVEAFSEALNGDLGETEAALAADDTRPETHLVARPGRVTVDQLAADCAELGLATESDLASPFALRLLAGDPGRLAAVRDGRAAVQDAGSQLCAIALARAPLAGPPTGGPAGRELVVDLCAGPGGKVGLLRGLLPEARFVAVEPRAARATLVRRSLADLPRSIVVRADGCLAPLSPASADRVLVDAPCSGLGALRRRPEARWRRTPDDIATLLPLQAGLLRAGVDLLRPGGVLAYVTCSPVIAETRGVVEAALAERSDLELLDAAAVLPEARERGPHVQLWPHRHGTDAMFLALLRKL